MTERERDKMVDACKGMTQAEATQFVARVVYACDLDLDDVDTVHSELIGADVAKEIEYHEQSDEAQ